jgi:hypothetical protein
MMVMEFPLIRWKMFETYLEDVDGAVEQIRNNRYSSVIEHLGGNVYLTVDNNDKTDCCVDNENWNVLGSTLPCLLFLGRLAPIPTRSCDGPTEHSRKRVGE